MSNFGLTALMEAINKEGLEESTDPISLMEEVSNDTVKQLALDREVAEEVEDAVGDEESDEDINKFIDSIPESEDSDDAYRDEDNVEQTLESLSVLTEQLEMKGVEV